MGKHINKRQPTEKQRLFFKYWKETKFAEGMAAECARKAGYAITNAKQRAHELKKNPTIRTAMQEALIEKGLDFDSIAGEAKRLALDSRPPFAPDMPDNEVRRRTLEMVGKMHDVFPSHKVDIRKTEARYDLTATDLKRLDDWDAEKIIDAEIIEEEDIESF